MFDYFAEEDEVSVVSLDESLSSYSERDCTDKDISDFVTFKIFSHLCIFFFIMNYFYSSLIFY